VDRTAFQARLDALAPGAVALTQRLVRCPSENPAGDTGPLADLIERELGGIECRRVTA